MTPVRRIVLWAMSTLTVLVLLFGYRTSTDSSPAAAAQGGDSSVTATSGGGSSSGSGTSSGGTSGTSGTSGKSGSSSSGTSTVTGSAASTRYGPVQVQITVTNGKVTDVQVLEYPDSDGRDEAINARALPILVSETLDAQSAKIDMVSGATYTSKGYVKSLQSALDQAGL